MAQPLVNSCCRCYSLRSGSISTGVLGILLSIISIILIFTVRIDFKTILMDWLPQNVVKIIYALNLVMTILISLLMIMGVMKKNHIFMMPWVVLGLMLAIGLLISVIYNAVVYFIDGFVLGGTLWLVIGLLSVVIYVYLWIVVYSYFVTLKNENDRGRYSKQPYRR
uniref:MARVEL domain-containing protein n=1 Tax=Anopheles epiroticus TaxID=199890 RepID=A0A182PW61_9DIPT